MSYLNQIIEEQKDKIAHLKHKNNILQQENKSKIGFHVFCFIYQIKFLLDTTVLNITSKK